MGLDQYAYVGYAGQYDDYDKQDGEFSGGEWVTKGEVSRPQELAYWRKHPDLHGYIVKTFAGGKDECQDIELGKDELEILLKAIEIDGRIRVLYSNKDYGCEWDYDFRNKRFLAEDNTKFGVNIVAYAMRLTAR